MYEQRGGYGLRTLTQSSKNGNQFSVVISSETLFYMAFILRFMASFVFSSTLGDVFGVISSGILDFFNIIVVGLLLVKIIFFQSYRKKEIVVIAIISGLLLVSAINARQIDFLLSWLFIVAAKNIRFQKIAKEVVCMTLIILPCMAGLSMGGIIENVVFLRADMSVRYSLGYSNPNTVGAMILQLCVAWGIYRNRKYGVKDIIATMMVAVIVNILIDCRSAMLLVVMFCGLVILFGRIIKRRRLVMYFCKSLLIIAPVFSIVSAVYFSFENKILSIYNDLTSWRGYYAYNYYKTYGFSIIGQNVEKLRAYLDNAYVHGAIIYGVVPLCIYLLGLWILVKRTWEKEDLIVLISVAIYCLYGLAEARIFIITNNFLLILLSKVVYEKKYNTTLLENQAYTGNKNE